MVTSVIAIPHIATDSRQTAMGDLHITNAGLERQDVVTIELSDGRTLVFSLEKLLALVPDSMVTEEDARKDDA